LLSGLFVGRLSVVVLFVKGLCDRIGGSENGLILRESSGYRSDRLRRGFMLDRSD
jgi:hypothetical protein